MRERKEAVAVCKLFLQHFVHTSSRQVIVWGPDETQSRRGLNCVTSLNTTWKTLVAAAQEQVLDPLAVTTGRQLTISREQGPRGAADIGVVTQITTVSLVPRVRIPNPLLPPFFRYSSFA